MAANDAGSRMPFGRLPGRRTAHGYDVDTDAVRDIYCGRPVRTSVTIKLRPLDDR